MRFVPTPFHDAWIIEPTPFTDERGSFARAYCEREFQEKGLNTRWVQNNHSINHQRGTLRGLHYQSPPHEEIKIVRCLVGAVFDVIVDLRQESPTYLTWQGFELSDRNQHSLYVPAGFAHGFQTLTDGAELYYHMSCFYHPESATGVRWNDPKLNIAWPLGESHISDKDRNLPLLTNPHT
ncbi:MAG: dTDP-4-dehydrorhamnose 3,5-epimerase [Magnetococcales bacterium]|nr:dTDP-4-dehydrorhamnose 3,5-epimerase [Magnetococcales bacterium]